ncbi:hypothetical protein [Paenibacillus sp. PvR148]
MTERDMVVSRGKGRVVFAAAAVTVVVMLLVAAAVTVVVMLLVAAAVMVVVHLFK